MYILSTSVQLRARNSQQDLIQLANFSSKTNRVRVRVIDWSASANENTFTKPTIASSFVVKIPPNRSQTYGISYGNQPPQKFEVEITVFDKLTTRRSIAANIYTIDAKGRFLGNNRVLDSQLILKRFATRLNK